MEVVRQLRIAFLSALLLTAVLVWGVSWQASVIENQQRLIRVLGHDSNELIELKVREQQEILIRHRLDRLKQEPTPGAAPGCLPRQICG